MNNAQLTISKTGRFGVIVWRRGCWRSMPHLITTDTPGIYMTQCGRKVELFSKRVDGIIITSIPSHLFIATGCGRCEIALMKELRQQIKETIPDANLRLATILQKLDWTVTL